MVVALVMMFPLLLSGSPKDPVLDIPFIDLPTVTIPSGINEEHPTPSDPIGS